MEIEKERLSQSERAQMKGILRAFMMEHPARTPLSLRFLDRAGSAIRAARSALALPRAQFATVFGLAVLFIGAGTSYAAESALPGDVLYSIKIHVNEKVAEALAPSHSARAAVVAAHTLRRLQEAETLAAQGRLSASTSAQIRSALQDTETDFDESVEAVARSPGGAAAAAADLQSGLEVTLASHARALTVIQATLPQSEASLTPILAAVMAHAERAKEARVEVDTAVAASTSPTEAGVVADKERKSAEKALSQVRLLVARTKKTLGTTSAEAVAHRALDAEQALNAGEKNLDEGDPARATSAFRAAIRTAVETQTDLDTAAHLKKILPFLSALSSAEATTTESSDLQSGF